MIDIKNPEDCCGCTACVSICNHNAITMLPDALGFLYPHVDLDKCVDCGLCNKVCSFNNDYDKSLNFPNPYAYAARHNNMSEVETSRSGAAFIALSDYILDNGGVIYGAGYGEHFRVVHKRAITKESRNEFKGSKYVQSDLSGVFLLVKDDLKKGRTVLFTGTPCQTSGLRSYIGKKYSDNLFLVDIVCHGVPSPSIWNDYLAYMEKKYRHKVVKVNFRDKSILGWDSHKETITFDNNTHITCYNYTHLFHQEIMLRKSCGKCYYANLKRPSDITIADFWGWEKTDQFINIDNKGVSLVLCNTMKGKTLFSNIIENMTVIPAELENCLQPNLCRPPRLHPKRNIFELDYQQRGFDYVYRRYGVDGLKYKISRFKEILFMKIKRIIK